MLELSRRQNSKRALAVDSGRLLRDVTSPGNLHQSVIVSGEPSTGRDTPSPLYARDEKNDAAKNLNRGPKSDGETPR